MAEPAGCSQLEQLAWLVGTWQAQTGKSLVTETWVEVSGATYEGAGTVWSRSDGRLMDSEDLRLVAMGGNVFYIAKVAHNERPVAFKLISCEDDRFVFENADHDFPRSIEYRRVEAARLEVNVSDGGERGFSLDFSRQPAG